MLLIAFTASNYRNVLLNSCGRQESITIVKYILPMRLSENGWPIRQLADRMSIDNDRT